MSLLRLFLILAACSAAVLPSFAADIKVGTYNVYASISRKNVLKDPATSNQRIWKYSSGAVASIIRDMDCDVMGLQEVCDSIAGYKGDNSLPELLKGAGYEWVLYSNWDDANPENKSIKNSAVCVIWKKNRFRLLEKGLFWLGGDPEHATVTDPGMKYTDRYFYKTCVWARLQDRKTKQTFWFLTAHPCVGSFSGIKGYKGRVPYPAANRMNARNLVQYADSVLVPKGEPSIIVGDMNAHDKHPSYLDYLTKRRWKDAYDILLEEGRLTEQDIAVHGTMNDKPETMVTKSRIDHILLDGFEVRSYGVDRDKYPTADGTLHYPSDHFPVWSVLEFK